MRGNGSKGGDREPHGIRIPGTLLDSIRDKEEKGDYQQDSRYGNINRKRKNKSHEDHKTRKQKRQEQRNLKKHKRLGAKPSVNGESGGKFKGQAGSRVNGKEKSKPFFPNPTKANTKTAKSHTKSEKSDDLDEDFEQDENPLETLRKLKSSKKGNNDVRIVKEDELDEGNFADDFGEDDFDEDDFDDFDEEDEEDENDEDPLAQLKALKEKKKKNQKKDLNKKEKPAVPPQVYEQLKKDEDDIAFYAKKLGLKKGKRANLSKTDENDMVGGLLDGLDFDFGSEDDNEESDYDKLSQEEEENDDDENSVAENGNYDMKPFSSDDSISEGDFDSDIDSEFDDQEENDEEFHTVPSQENPFVAPQTEHSSETKYIPPALRRKMALESGELSAETMALQRTIKGLINKLSEGNLSSIVNDINGLYLSNPRNVVNETLTSIIIDGILQQGRLLETFVVLQSCVITAVYRLQGVEFGAHFIQSLVEKFEIFYKDSNLTKETSNIISLLSSTYSFQLVSSKLIYDIIKVLLKEFNESNAEILLRLIRNCGNQIRTDDPTALKEIILLMNEVSSSMKQINPRTQFLIETINSLKNNKLKVANESTHDLSLRLKKFLGTLGSGTLTDPIQVSFDDIKNVDTKGKWWLIGSAWKGNENVAQESTNFDAEAMNDILDNAEPNWVQIAKDQRMNTDIRRAIFITIMSAEDYIDALTKLDKLQLKKSQEREIPRILIHCVSVEPSWNPYYGLLAHKLSAAHSYRKTFQFMFWDILKEFEKTSDTSDGEEEDFFGFDNNNDDDDSDTKLKKIYNLGRFFGYLMTEGSLPMYSLRNINFLVASNDTKLFLEIILVTFLDQIAKKSQVSLVGTGLGSKVKTSDMKFSDKLLIERILKAKDEHTLLRGLQYFTQERTSKSNFIDGKRQRKRVEWGSNAMFDVIEELLSHTNDRNGW